MGFMSGTENGCGVDKGTPKREWKTWFPTSLIVIHLSTCLGSNSVIHEKRRNKEKPVCICPSNLGPGVKEQKLAGRAQQGTRGEEAQQNEDDMMMSYHGHEQHIATKDNISGYFPWSHMIANTLLKQNGL